MSELIVTLIIASLPLYLIVSALISGYVPFSRFRDKVMKTVPVFMISLCAVTLIVLGVLYSSGQHSDTALVRITPVSAVVLTLVVVLGAVISRFSQRYMMAEACYPTFVRWLHNLLAAVLITVVANHLLIFFVGWVAISLCLHRMLVLYPERSRALLAARKKFLMARSSELLLAVAFIALYVSTGSAYIGEINTTLVQTADAASPLMLMSAICIASAALLKCAQLPFHGWLIQVVEVPTPVSALLHAGIINLGGYLLMVFAPLMSLYTAANWMILVFAGLSLVFASLVMTTRVTVKVKLAWSTSAQMSLMLIQCALGLYGFALLHMVAHSLYKSYSFLSAGQTVQRSVTSEFANKQPSSLADWLNAALVALVITLTTVYFFADNEPVTPWFILFLSLSTLLAVRFTPSDQSHFYLWILTALGLALCYGLLKSLFTMLQPNITQVPPGSAMDIWVMGLLSFMFILHLWLERSPTGKWAEKIRAQLFGGLFLDEWFTRATLTIWPASSGLKPGKQSHPKNATTSIRR